MRIQKWLSQLGVLSRRQAEAYIKEDRIKVNGAPASLGMSIVPESDQITVDGKLVKQSDKAPSKLYWVFNKPDFTLVSRVSQNDMPTIYEASDLKRVPFRLNTVGRLDFRTEGLLILSNDGELINKLSHPSSEAPRVYHVLIPRKLTRDEIKTLNDGAFSLQGRPVRCKVATFCGTRLGKSRGAWYEVTVYEGRNRLVRRMFEKLETRVVRLVRISYAGISLPTDLKPGRYKALTPEEIRKLKSFLS